MAVHLGDVSLRLELEIGLVDQLQTAHPSAPETAEQTEVEFYVPARGTDFKKYLLDDDIIGLHHLSRYEWAVRVLRDRKPRCIIDVACGAGYGSHMLADNIPCASVSGCDYDPRSAIFARDHYQANNLNFVTGDIVTWCDSDGVSLGKFDAIVTFDTIEHVEHREIALLSLCRNLADDGAMLFSTPSAHRQNLLKPSWEHHKIEYCAQDLSDLMRRFFRVVLSPADSDFPHRAFWSDEVNGASQRYPNIANPLFCQGPIR